MSAGRAPQRAARTRRPLEELAERVLARTTPVRLTGLRGAARAVVGAEFVRAHGAGPVLFLAASSKACDALLGDLECALGDRAVRACPFPRHDTLPYDRFSPQPFVVAQRMSVLHHWVRDPGPARREPAPIVVAPWTAFAARVPSRSAIRERTLELVRGDSIDRDALVDSLLSRGYARMPLVEERGELAVRGGVLDVFPPQSERPVRAELLGDEIESLREFDPASQRSKRKLDRIALPPPRELLVDRELVVERSDALHAWGEQQSFASGELDELVDALLRGHLPPGCEALAPFLQPELECALAFLPDDTLVVIDDPEAGERRLADYFEEAQQSYAAALDSGRPASTPDELLIPPRELLSAVLARKPVALERLGIRDAEATSWTSATRESIRSSDQGDLRRELTRARTREHALNPLADQLATWSSDRWRIVISCATLSGAERVRTLLSNYGLETHLANDARPCWGWSKPGRVEVRVAPLSEGFTLESEPLAVVTEEEIFGPREKRHRKKTWEEGAAVDGLAQLAVGDYLVHAEHGIGTYRGLLELATRGFQAELLCLEYLGGDRLFLPVHRINLVHRYGGADGVSPRIDRLGGQTWEKARRSVRRSLRNMAEELLGIHAARELATGFSFSPRDAYFEEFEGSFAFEETPDQLAAIEDVLGDMMNRKPMDRLVCGDVGYGKTEVAVRAAFRAAMDGKQVAVLVPTTVLCQQHEETFRERFRGYPISVESLSRFRTPAESREVLEGLASGRIDVVIGTHRLLHNKVQFRELGLLVVDEEHRFGVTHKERIKKLKRTVDVLTLTATPIPRTLQMAFAGVRELSLINTPPADRFAVRTQVCRYNESLIREALLREVRRGGQAFFVHNRVRSIPAVAEMLERVVPEVSVISAHGQMKERDLEDRMLRFLAGEADVLLCTAIIESGLDIPRANTIVINRAHTFGLAQLYQLRGRVGRSNHRAYAYLVVPSEDALSADAERRLEAIQDLSELSSGFRLANMDLEIRGAGNLLGAEQSGNLAAVGYETYMEMLAETVEELRGRIKEVEIDPEIRLPVPARLPEDFVPDVSQRLVLYKRLASARDEADLDQVRDEILDRYGPLPVEASSLLEVIGLKIRARRLGILSLDLVRGEVVLAVAESSSIDANRLVSLMTQGDGKLRVTPDRKVHAPGPPSGAGPEALFEVARSALSALADA